MRPHLKTIGLLGGMTPESTKLYYDEIIALGRDLLPDPLDNPVVIIYSVNLAEIFRLQKAGLSREVAETLAAVFERLRQAGAEIGSLTANTPHAYLDEIVARTQLPLVSILDSTLARAHALDCKRALLLGTRTTMASAMYPDCFAADGLEIIVPNPDNQEFIDDAIYNELSIGRLDPDTRARFIAICQQHIAADKVDAIILGCTEIPLLLDEGDLPVPLIDTARAHAAAIFARAQLGD